MTVNWNGRTFGQLTEAERREVTRAAGAQPPGACPNCHGEREWSGTPGTAAICHFCGQSA